MTGPVDLTADPTVMGIDLNGWVATDPSVRFTSVQDARPVAPRATSVITLTAEEPVIYLGRPVMPAHRISAPLTMRATTGATHIRGKNNPAPVWDPVLGTWTYPPGAGGVGTYRWVVAPSPPPATSLPDVDGYDGGTYPLGSPSGSDETQNIPLGQQGWYPDGGSAVQNGPIWHADYPFKPTVVSRDSVVNGKVIHHPVGVSFSSDNCSFMWLDMGVSKPQPITWIIVMMPLRRYPKSFPLRQVFLEAGRNPYAVGVPQKTPAQLGNDIVVNDGLAYHTALSTSGDNYQMSTNPKISSLVTGGDAVAGSGMSGIRPIFTAAVFNGANSVLYTRDNLKYQRVTGAVSTGAAYQHRYYVLGRDQGYISQLKGQEMIVFEMRYWDRALTDAEIESQYAELSSTYLFSQYKT